jgi:hypothetical protein
VGLGVVRPGRCPARRPQPHQQAAQTADIVGDGLLGQARALNLTADAGARGFHALLQPGVQPDMGKDPGPQEVAGADQPGEGLGVEPLQLAAQPAPSISG